jgi:tetratricopeptide (TPR) repeat protein
MHNAFVVLVPLALVSPGGSLIAAASNNPTQTTVYACLKVETDGVAHPRTECSDYEAERAFKAIGNLFDTGRNQDGLTFLETLVAAKPFNSDFRRSLVERRLALSQTEGVENHLSTLAKLDPNSEKTLLLAARAFFQIGKRDEAIALLSTHLETHALNREARQLRAQFFEKTGKWKQAQTDWHILEKSRVSAQEQVRRLMASIKENQFQSVVKELEPKVNNPKVPFDATLSDLLAQAYFGLGRLEEAGPLWDKTLQSSPENADVRLRFAKLLVEKKRYEDAVLHLTRILSQEDGHPGAIYQLSKVRILQERFDLAGQALAKLSNLDPDNLWSVQAQAQLWNRLGHRELAALTLKSRGLDLAVLPEDAAAPEPERTLTSSIRNPCMQHLVQKGETLEGLSMRYFKTPHAWNSILGPNAGTISDPHRIKEGMVLWIPQNRETGKCGE